MIFLIQHQRHEPRKEIMDKLDSIKNFCSAKDTVKKIKIQETDWEKILQKTKVFLNNTDVI